MKRCSKCKSEKPESEFYKKRSSKDGLNSQCIPCNKESKRQWNDANRRKYLEMKRGYYLRNREKILSSQQDYYQNNRDKVLEQNKRWAEKNRDRNLEGKRKWYLNNRDRHRELGRAWMKSNAEKKRQNDHNYYKAHQDRIKRRTSMWAKSNREKIRARHQQRKSDTDYAAAIALRSTLKNFLRRAMIQKTAETSELLGYTSEMLIKRMECQFSAGQSWSNYGTEWHIDHKIPVAHFLAKGEFRAHIVNALSNLQPLWAEENLAKGAKLLSA